MPRCVAPAPNSRDWAPRSRQLRCRRHRDGLAIWLVFAMEGYFGNLIRGNGFGGNYDGLQWSGLNDGIARWRDDPDSLPPNLKLGMLMGEDAGSRYRRHYFVKAMNLVRRLREAYDRALSEHDLLLMPTVPAKARPLPGADASPETVINLAFENIDNTCPFNLTHHPALTVPCGIVDGCPVGMMLVAKPFAESDALRRRPCIRAIDRLAPHRCRRLTTRHPHASSRSWSISQSPRLSA